MDNFKYFAPTEVIFGKGVEEIYIRSLSQWK